MEKSELRDKLFSKYFEVEDGLLATTLMEKTSFIRFTWQQLYEILKTGNNDRIMKEPEGILKIDANETTYLIINLGIYNYIIIDLASKNTLSKEEALRVFSEAFFVQNFNEHIEEPGDFNMLSHFFDFSGNIDAVDAFYEKNKDILNLPIYIDYRINLGDAWTFMQLALTLDNSMLGFMTKDQFLYEFLFLKSDLSPATMQDAVSKIGKERMLEMFEKIKDIKIPWNVIPECILTAIGINRGDMARRRKKE